MPHHREISHTLAVFLKHVYEEDEEFVYYKNLVGNTKHLALTKHAYLMPPKQRSMARFMNLFPIVDWAKKCCRTQERRPEMRGISTALSKDTQAWWKSLRRL